MVNQQGLCYLRSTGRQIPGLFTHALWKLIEISRMFYGITGTKALLSKTLAALLQGKCLNQVYGFDRSLHLKRTLTGSTVQEVYSTVQRTCILSSKLLLMHVVSCLISHSDGIRSIKRFIKIHKGVEGFNGVGNIFKYSQSLYREFYFTKVLRGSVVQEIFSNIR